jgi:hypothetical protein
VQASAVVPAFVQSKSASSGSSEVASLDITLDTGATAGHLIVVGGCSDATLTAPSGFSTGASAINAQGLCLWYKIAAGGETALTATPSVSRPVALVAAVYSGITGTSPADQTASANSAGSSTTGPIGAGATGTTTQASELVVAVTGPHSYPDSAAPTSPTWSNGYTGRAAAASTFATSSRNSAVFIADLVVAATGAQQTDTSWTNSAFDWGAVVVTFKAG